jgi:hypothetical protein
MSDNSKKINNVISESENPKEQIPDLTTNLTAEGKQTPDLPATPTVQASYFNPEKEIDKLYKWLYAIVIAVVIAFFFMLFDFINEKQIIINYGNLADKYFDKYLELNKFVNDLNNATKDQKISELSKQNDKLINITECLKNKKYWQYEQCFK